MKPAKELWLEIQDRMFDKDWPRPAVEIIRNAQIEAWRQGVNDTVEMLLHKHLGESKPLSKERVAQIKKMFEGRWTF